ncbi:DNA internalization-related competence protein ComEC/Rec2 [Lachnospiraceae bacterium XBB1006]|nr:DNA internalization-related competence protein ComEC/Rec2 [Lachnospiraceae bacterium XBB1006]
MEKRPFVWVFLACMLGIAVAYTRSAGLMAGVGVVLGGLLYRMKRQRRLVLVATGMLLLGFFRAWCYNDAYDEVQRLLGKQENNREKNIIQGLIIQTKEGEKSYQYRIHHCRIQRGTAVLSIPDILLYQSKSEMAYPYAEGTYLTADATLEVPVHARNDGGFDEATYDYGVGIVGKGFSNKCMPEIEEQRLAWYIRGEAMLYKAAWELKQSFCRMYAKHLTKEQAGVVSAVCLGRRELVEKSVQEQFRMAGIAHVLAISGVHIGIVGCMLLYLLKKGAFSLKLQMVAGCLFVLLFALGTGGTSSALRAGIMFGVYLGSVAIGRSYDGPSSMAFSGIWLLLVAPFQLFSLSFQFSFVAVAAVFFGKEWIGRTYRKLHPTLQTLVISDVLFVATFPLVWWYQWQVALFSMVLNLLVIPLVTPLLSCGLLGGGLGVLGIPCLPTILIRIAGGTAWGILRLANGYLRLPGSHPVLGHPPVWSLFLYVSAVVSVLFYGYYKKNFLVILIPSVVILVICGMPRPKTNAVTFLDVGQGDGIVVETKEGYTFMLDGGSSDEAMLGNYTIKPFLLYHGKAKVDVWFVSHLDEDHISGLLELLKAGYPIGRLCFLDAVENDPRFATVKKMAVQQNIPISYMRDKERLTLGNVEIRALGRATDNPNDSSLALLLRFVKEKRTYWFGGDISAAVEEQLVTEIKQFVTPGDVVYMKANHHGSNGSNGAEFLRALKPHGIVISCGKHNRYGHPGREALLRMKQQNIPYVVTMEMGQVRFD